MKQSKKKMTFSEQDKMPTKVTILFFFSHSTIRPTTEDLLEQTFIAILAFSINEIKLFLSFKFKWEN